MVETPRGVGGEPDGLPADAWTGLSEQPAPPRVTRTDARPFDHEERLRILRVGTCLACHEWRGAASPGIYNEFARSLEAITPFCDAGAARDRTSSIPHQDRSVAATNSGS